MTSISKIKSGHYMGFINWVKVLRVNQDSILVEDLEKNQQFEIRGQKLVESGMSADVYTKTETVSQTELLEKFVESKNTPVTINFVKANGDIRTMKCRWLSQEKLRGRSLVYDFEETKRSPIKQVDHRTVNWMILEGVKYTVKS